METIGQLKTVLCVATICLFAATSPVEAQSSNTFTVAAYNVENWVLMDRFGKQDQPKPDSERTAVLEIIAAVRPDVLGLGEMGQTNDLADVAAGLRQRGLDYPYSEWIQGSDGVRHVALLSRFPITERFSRNDYTYQLNDKPMLIQRGFLDVLVQVNDHYAFRAIVVHLKSKRPTDEGDQAVMRLEEARLLRQHIGKVLKKDPHLNLLAIGDFNDTPESEAMRTIIGDAPFQLVDLVPVDSQGKPYTHLRRRTQEYSRIDYLVASPAMSNEYVAGSARAADPPGWDKGSDHRAIYARFYDHDLDQSAPVETSTTAARRATAQGTILIMVTITIGLIVVISVLIYRHRQSRAM